MQRHSPWKDLQFHIKIWKLLLCPPHVTYACQGLFSPTSLSISESTQPQIFQSWPSQKYNTVGLNDKSFHCGKWDSLNCNFISFQTAFHPTTCGPYNFPGSHSGCGWERSTLSAGAAPVQLGSWVRSCLWRGGCWTTLRQWWGNSMLQGRTGCMHDALSQLSLQLSMHSFTPAAK